MKTMTLFACAAAAAVVSLYSASDARPCPSVPAAALSGCISYCTAGTSTNGCVATLSCSGTPSLQNPCAFTITASNVEGMKNGIFRYSINGQNNTPFAAGSSSFICIRPPQQKMGPVKNSGGVTGQCNGQLSVDVLCWLASHSTALGQPLMAGTTLYVQATYKDPPAPKALNFTDAVQFDLEP